MYILRGSDNIVTLTLTEKSTLNDSEYVIKFVNDTTGSKTERVVAVTDISEFTERYNKFVITESTSEDLTNSVVNLNPPGQWTYTAYEMPSTSPRSLDISLAIGIVEQDRCLVEGPDDTKNFFTDNNNKNTGVFRG